MAKSNRSGFTKHIKKVAKRVRGKLIKRYFNKGYAPNIKAITKDIDFLKSMVNAEKHRLYIPQTSYVNVSQINYNSSGHYITDITCLPSQGVGYTQKIGSSIKVHSLHIDFQFTAQPNNLSGIKLKIQLVQVVGQVISSGATVINQLYVANPFITSATVYDINSPRNPDFFKNYRVISTKYVTLKPDSITGEVQLARVGIGKKFDNYHVRCDQNTTNVTEGQLYLVITADRGNQNATASTSSGVVDATASSGVYFLYNTTYYFYDN